eukprot:3125735-Pyramimonas_sp.AAC.1
MSRLPDGRYCRPPLPDRLESDSACHRGQLHGDDCPQTGPHRQSTRYPSLQMCSTSLLASTPRSGPVEAIQVDRSVVQRLPVATSAAPKEP